MMIYSIHPHHNPYILLFGYMCVVVPIYIFGASNESSSESNTRQDAILYFCLCLIAHGRISHFQQGYPSLIHVHNTFYLSHFYIQR